MVKKNLSILVVVLLALLLIMFVIWVFDRRIKSIDKKINPPAALIETNRLILLKTFVTFKTE